MKKIYFLILISSLFSFQSYSQELMAETGFSFTSFEFKNSQGVELNDLQPTTNNYISLGYRHNVLKDVLHLIGGLSINKYGAIGSNDAINLYYRWETTYLGIYIGLDAKVYQTNKLSFYIRATASPEFMMQGTQTINNQVFDLNGVDEFDTANFFFRGGLLIEYKLSDTFSIFTRYNYGKSTDNGIEQELKFATHDVGFGLVINLKPNTTIQETTNQK